MKDPVQLGNKFINTLCDILGLTSPRIRKITIVAEYNNAVKIEIEQLGTVAQCDKVAKALEGIDVEISQVVIGKDWIISQQLPRQTAYLLPSATILPAGDVDISEYRVSVDGRKDESAPCSCPGPAGSAHVYPCPYWKGNQ